MIYMNLTSDRQKLQISHIINIFYFVRTNFLIKFYDWLTTKTPQSLFTTTATMLRLSSFMTSTLALFSSDSREPCVATASSNRSIHFVNVPPHSGSWLNVWVLLIISVISSSPWRSIDDWRLTFSSSCNKTSSRFLFSSSRRRFSSMNIVIIDRNLSSDPILVAKMLYRSNREELTRKRASLLTDNKLIYTVTKRGRVRANRRIVH